MLFTTKGLVTLEPQSVTHARSEGYLKSDQCAHAQGCQLALSTLFSRRGQVLDMRRRIEDIPLEECTRDAERLTVQLRLMQELLSLANRASLHFGRGVCCVEFLKAAICGASTYNSSCAALRAAVTPLVQAQTRADSEVAPEPELPPNIQTLVQKRNHAHEAVVVWIKRAKDEHLPAMRERVAFLRQQLKLLAAFAVREGSRVFAFRSEPWYVEGSHEPGPLEGAVYSDQGVLQNARACVATYDGWLSNRSTIADHAIANTDRAFQELGVVLAALCADPRGGEAARQKKLQTALDALHKEENFWLSDATGRCPCTYIHQNLVESIRAFFQRELAHLSELLQAFKGLSRRKLHTFVCPKDASVLLGLADDAHELAEELEDTLHDLGKHERKATRKKLDLASSAHDAAVLRRAVAVARTKHVRSLKAIEHEKARLAQLMAYFPELPLLFPKADILSFSELGCLVNEGLIFQPADGGSFSDVHKIYAGRHDIYSGTLAGVRYVLKEHSFSDVKDKKLMMKEVNILKSLEHPCIVEVTSVVLSQHSQDLKAYIQQPLYGGGDMLHWLAEQRPNTAQLRAVLHQVVRGTEYLHGKGIVHCDLKLRNVFMSSASPNASPRIGDFDVSKDSDARCTETTVAAASS